MVAGYRRARWSRWLTGAVVAAVLAGGCTETPRAGIGEPCATHDDCVAGAQCFANQCAPRCAAHAECGNGYVCRDDGVCERVASQIGDACGRELDCGPRQSCQVDPRDDDGDGRLGATCQMTQAGVVTGAPCAADGDCGSGLCALGRCSEVCATAGDCPTDLACVDIPRLLPGSSPIFRGCLPATGLLQLDVPVTAPATTLRVPVPSHARSFALVSAVADPRHWVGATRVEDPHGELLYRTPLSEADYYANRLRYAPGQQTSTLLLPSSPEAPLEVGAYTIDVAALHGNGTVSTEVPDVRLIYRLVRDDDDRGLLDVNLYFVDLVDHPCDAAFPDGLDATRAPTSAGVHSYLAALDELLAAAHLAVGEVTYHDVVGRPDLDAIDRRELGALLSESTTAGGVNVFFVRSIHPVGVQALAGGSPGTPGIAGTPASGVAVAVDTLCYRSWSQLAHTTAHIVARQLGLFRNIEPDGHEDPIPDSDASIDNLLHFSEFAGSSVTPQQAAILRANPVIE